MRVYVSNIIYLMRVRLRQECHQSATLPEEFTYREIPYYTAHFLHFPNSSTAKFQGRLHGTDEMEHARCVSTASYAGGGG